MKEKFYSQYGEDKWIIENLKLPDIGIFIDRGAAHPEKFSNSLHFEERGWSVICIEPQQEFFHPFSIFNFIEVYCKACESKN